jgi:hypothetical protein
MGPIRNSSQIAPGIGLQGGFSVDDGGMDEYDVADERAHLFEVINPDNMTYEELLALQERIGFVSKGLSREKINSFPKMRKKDILKYLNKKMKKKSRLIEEDKIEVDSLNSIDIRNPLEESKRSGKKKSSMIHSRRLQNSSAVYNEDELDEVVDGDEGVINRRLPINSYNHQA